MALSFCRTRSAGKVSGKGREVSDRRPFEWGRAPERSIGRRCARMGVFPACLAFLPGVSGAGKPNSQRRGG